jgi:hypothetical protein
LTAARTLAWAGGNWSRSLLALALLATAWPSVAAAGETTAVGTTLAVNGRTVSVTGPGLTGCQGGFAATIKVGDQALELSSSAGTVVGPAQHLTEETPCGPAEVSATTIHFGQEQADLLFRFGRVAGVPGVLAQAGIRNVGKEPVCLMSVTPLALEMRVGGDPAEWLVTALDQSVKEVFPVVALNEVRTPLSIHEYGGLYRHDGSGFLFGPVGQPLAYVDARLTPGADGKLSFCYSADMSGVRVDSGETCWGQQVILLLEPPRPALVRWAEWVSKTHGARTAKGALSGWNSWNFLGREVAGKDVLAVVDEVLKCPARLRPGVIEIADGYQDVNGRKETNDKFPEGLAYYGQRIAATGARPGLFLDFFGTTGAPQKIGSSGWDDIVRRIEHTTHSGFTYQLNDRCFAVDKDTYYMGTDIQNLSGIAGKWPMVRTWMSMAGLSCGTAITSDPLSRDSFKPYWRNMEVMTPPARERTEVLDLGTNRDWPRMLGIVKREWGDLAVALLWNPGLSEQAITLDFAQAGLDPRHRYAVWSFWDDRFLGVAQGSWTTQTMEPLASQQLCFTDLDRNSNNPVLVGSNLLIYCGAAEIQRVVSSRGSMAIGLTDAGARDGDLFVYSRFPLLLRSATGCAVTGVAQAGENVWRISLAERQCGVPQRLDLTVALPVTRQGWFWLLIALVAASLAFAASRYLVGLRLQREHALEIERARIARDIHDDLGTSLTRVSVMADDGSARQ